MSDQLRKKRQQERKERQKQNRRLLSETWLFVCEGSKSEPNYIKSLIDYANSKTSVSQLKKRVEGEGKNTESLVRSVDDLLADIDVYKGKSDIPYARVFVLFDKDSFGAGKFDNAVKMCDSRGYIPIWSNECFELWYIIHFMAYMADNGREWYFNKLSDILKVKYQDKKAMDVFSKIHSSEKIKLALKRAEKLDNDFQDEAPHLSPSKRVPCTKIYILVRELEKRLKIEFSNI